MNYYYFVILELRREVAGRELVIFGTGIHQKPIVIGPDISSIP